MLELARRFAAMKERRSSARQKSFLQGRIYFNNRRSSVDCLVRDISAEGAKLMFSETVALPEAMELHIPNKDETYRAKVQWRTGTEVGVGFEADDLSPSLVPGAAPTDVLGRIHKLECDVATLQRKVNELQNELRLRQGSDI